MNLLRRIRLRWPWYVVPGVDASLAYETPSFTVGRHIRVAVHATGHEDIESITYNDQVLHLKEGFVSVRPEHHVDCN